jgi:hypothetical protein
VKPCGATLTPSLTVGLLPRLSPYDIKLENNVAKIIPRINARIQIITATLQPVLELTFVPALANALALNHSP